MLYMHTCSHMHKECWEVGYACKHTQTCIISKDKLYVQIKLWLHVCTGVCVWSRYVPILKFLINRLLLILHWSYIPRKLLILYRNQKGFLLSPVYNHLKDILAYRAPTWRKPTMREQFFSSKQTCLKNKLRYWLPY